MAADRVGIPLAVGLLVVSAAVAAHQPQTPPRQTPEATFRGGVELVEVTVSVVDADGRAVTNLTRNDFEVRESGKPQSIALFDRVEIPLPPVVAPWRTSAFSFRDEPRSPSIVADVISNDFPSNGRVFAIGGCPVAC